MSVLGLEARVASVRRASLGVTYWVALGYLSLVVLAAVIAPLVIPQGLGIDFDAILSPPTAAHPLGTNQLGQDTLLLSLRGTSESLVAPVLLLVLATVVGVTMGLVAAWNGGWIDTVLARTTDVMFAFPGLLFVVLVISVLGKGPQTAVVALGIAFAPVIAKYTRSIALSELALTYIEAYRSQGVGSLTIVVRYVLPNLAPLLAGYLVVLFGDALMSLATLSYLGFGAQPPSSEWGLSVQQGQSALLMGYPLPSLVPAAAIASVVVAVNIVGVRLAERMGER